MTPPRNKGRRILKMSALTYALMVKHMLDGDHNCQELADITGLHYVTVLHYTRELHRAGAAHIHMWEKDAYGRDSIRIYKIGAGRDAKRAKMTPAERQARHRVKSKQLELMRRLAA